jgi:uridine kinase
MCDRLSAIFGDSAATMQVFVEPSRSYADIIIPGVNDVTPAVNLITNHIRQLLSAIPDTKEGI